MHTHVHTHTYACIICVWGTFISECMYAAQGMTVKIAFTQTMSNQYNYL